MESTLMMSSTWVNSTTNSVGFGTAALGGNCAPVVTMALQEGFRFFDTAEADWWYDQKAVGTALEQFFTSSMDDECLDSKTGGFCGSLTCETEALRVSTKIGPWDLTSEEHIRRNAAQSRQELVGFCEDQAVVDEHNEVVSSRPFPLDVYYIHAPTCWPGWHSRCDKHPPLLELRDSWRAMEAIVGIDHSAMRIGLSNIDVNQLEDIVAYVKERRQQQQRAENSGVIAPPRIPDVVQAFADPLAPADALRSACQKHGIEFVSYSTLGTQHRNNDGQNNPVLTSPIVTEIARKHKRSIAEVVLSWALHKKMSIIPRSSRREHIRELARLLPSNNENALFLDSEDIFRIDGMKNTA